MKKFLAVLFSVIFLTPSYVTAITIKNPAKKLEQHFRDVRSDSKLNKIIDSAIFRGILNKGSFFRSEAEVPAIMFFEILLKDSGVEVKSREFSKILKLAIKNNFVEEKVAKNIQFDTPLTKLRAISSIIKAKKLRPARRVSAKFRGIFPLTNIVKRKDLSIIETAISSGILSEFELKKFQPNELVTRREFLTWIYNYHDHGTRQVKMEADSVFKRNQRSFRYNSGLKSRFSIEKRKRQQEKIFIKRKSREKNNLKTNRLNNSKISNISKVRNPFPGREVLDEIYNEIVEKYRFPEELNNERKQEMEDRALSALVQSLGDKYSSYIRPVKSKEFIDKINGEFEGIGAYVEMVDGKFTIIAPIGGSPAEKFGLQPQDIVIEVDGKDINGLSINEIVELIMGPAGTNVDLRISRDFREMNFVITRDRIVEPNVTLEWKKNVPIIKINRFNPDTEKLMTEKIKEILKKNPRGIVLDLRNNPGGLLTSAQDVGSLFLNKGEVVFYTEDRTNTQAFKSKKDGILANFKNIVILQNKGTASASEILIGELRDNLNVKIVGETSLGKGTVQTVRDLKNGGLLKLTIAKWLTPNKDWIHEIGISPDLIISNPTNEERKKGIDKQLDAAVREVLN